MVVHLKSDRLLQVSLDPNYLLTVLANAKL
jgi:hypothetical protein